MADGWEPNGQGAALYQDMLDAGAAAAPVEQWKQGQKTQMLEAGAHPNDVAAYWGEAQPDTSAIQAHVAANIGQADPAAIAKGPMDAIAAGWNQSITSLKQHAPDMVLPDTASLPERILAGVSEAAGDLPTMLKGGVVGALAGGALGGAVGGPIGAGIGAGAGAWGGAAALDAAQRKMLMDHYAKGDITSVADFASRLSAATIDGLKAGVPAAVGGAIAGPVEGLAEPFVGKFLGSAVGLEAATAAATQLSANVAGKAHADLSDFIVGGIGILGLHAAGSLVGAMGRVQLNSTGAGVTENLADVYTETGLPPARVAEMAKADPAVMSEVLAPRAADGTLLLPTLKVQALPEPEPYSAPEPIEEPTPEAKTAVIAAQAAAEEKATDQARVRSLAVQGEPGGWIPPEGAGGSGEPPPPPLGEPAIPMGGPRVPPSADELQRRILSLIDPNGAERPTPAWLDPQKWIAMAQSELAPAVRFDRATRNIREVMFKDLEKPPTRSTSREIVMGHNGGPPMDAEPEPITPDDMTLEDRARQMYASKSRANYFVKNGTLRINLKTNAYEHSSDNSIMGAYKAVKEDGGDRGGFIAYRMALRTVQKAAQKIKTGTDLQDAKDFLAVPGNEAKYARGTKIMKAVKDAAVDYMVQAGRLSVKQGQNLKLWNEDHISYRRVQDPNHEPMEFGRGIGQKQTLKRMKGGTGQILNPIVTDVSNLHLMIAEADRTLATRHIVRLVKFNKEAMEGMGISESHDLAVDDAELRKELLDAQGNPVSDEAKEALRPFYADRAMKGNLQPHQFPHYEDGKLKIYNAIDKDLAELMRAPYVENPIAIVQFAQKFAALQRSGIMGNLSYPFRAIGHGQIAAAALSPGTYMAPYHDILLGLIDAFGGGKLALAAKANGALNASLADMDRDALLADTQDVFDKTGTTGARNNTFPNPYTALRALQTYGDHLARTGRMIHNQRAGTSAMAAAMIARVAHLDFNERMGLAAVQMATRTVTFASVAIKTIQQLARAAYDRPWQTVLRGIGTLTLPTIALTLANIKQDKDLPDGQKSTDIPQSVRDHYWVGPVIYGVRVQWPKPRTVGLVFATAMEHILHLAAEHEPEAFAKFSEAFMRDSIPPFVPAIVTPAAEDWADKHFYSGQALTPASTDRLTDWMRYSPATTETAKAAARVLGPAGLGGPSFSPAVLENWVNGMVGPAPLNFLHTIEQAVKTTGRPWEAHDLPFFGAFIGRHDWGLSAQPVQDAFNAADPLIENLNSLNAAIKTEGERAALEHRDPTLMTTDIKAAANALGVKITPQTTQDSLRQEPILAQVGTIAGAEKAFHRAYAMIAGINNSAVTDAEKRKYTDIIASNMIAAAHSVLAMTNSLKNPAAGAGAPP